jgi:hypothetical protein
MGTANRKLADRAEGSRLLRRPADRLSQRTMSRPPAGGDRSGRFTFAAERFAYRLNLLRRIGNLTMGGTRGALPAPGCRSLVG